MLQPQRTVAAEPAHAAVTVFGHGSGVHSRAGRRVPVAVRGQPVRRHRGGDGRRGRGDRRGHAVHVEAAVVVVGHRRGRQRGVEAPGTEAFSEGRSRRNFCGDPVVVGGVA